jgi:biotin transport system permease protein
MLTYRPGQSLCHRLDPRTKLFLQVGVAAAAFAYTTPVGLALLSGLTLLVLLAANVEPLAALRSYRFVFPFLLLGPLVAAVTVGPPWIRPADAVEPILASYRVLLVLLVGAAAVRTTAVRESQAAVSWLVPGRVGRVLGLGIGLVFRFLPVLRRDLLAIRDAMAARLGDERPVTDRIRLLTTTGLSRAFGRSDRLALALQARCLSWDPTLPDLQFTRRDLGPLLLGAGLLLASVLPLLPGY